MAVIQYQCDVCDRIIDLPQNKKGLEVIQRCIITDGCRGKLSQLAIKLDHLRGSFPDRVKNLNDYVQRQTLYNHRQSVKLEQWDIVHNLGVAPSIQIFVERPKDVNLNEIDLTVVDPNSLVEFFEVDPESVEIVDGNHIKVNFEQPEKGIVQLIAKSTKPKVFDNSPILDDSAAVIELTHNSELTIATKSDDASINLVLTFTTPTGLIYDRPYTVDNVSIDSAWSDFDEALIAGTKYTIRSFDFKDNDPIFNTDIPSGSSVYIKSINGASLERREVLGLLTNYPYEVQDKNVDQYVDFFNINVDNLASQIIFNENDLLIETKSLSSVFPSILRI